MPAGDILDELEWRGQLEQLTDADRIRTYLSEPGATVYCGFDPTAPSLQIGNLVPLIGLHRFQRAGHAPIVVVGGGTGLIGDPRQESERMLNPEEVVAEWRERLKAQAARFVDFDSSVAPARIVDNYDWLGRLQATDFLRDVGKHFPVNYMLAKETVRTRLEGEGISFTEFSYMLLQAYDYLHLARTYGCRLQIGGADQWGNITAGCELIRRAGERQADALTLSLVTKSDGTKFGKTEAGAVYIDPELTSVYDFYQFWLQADDGDVIAYLKIYSDLGRDEIAGLEAAVAERPEAREAQRRLADVVTAAVHGEPARASAARVSDALFGRGELRGVDPAALESALDGAPTVRLPPAAAAPSYAELLVQAGLATSLSDADRLVAGGGVYVNDARLEESRSTPDAGDFLGGRLLVLRRGRRNRAVVVREH
jgi:tyrosyl-tRNA synthetase